MQSHSAIKRMLIVFFIIRGIVHHEFVPQCQTVNAQFYCSVLRRVREDIRRKRPELWRAGNWLLHDANAPSHRALATREILAHNNVTTFPEMWKWTTAHSCLRRDWFLTIRGVIPEEQMPHPKLQVKITIVWDMTPCSSIHRYECLLHPPSVFTTQYVRSRIDCKCCKTRAFREVPWTPEYAVSRRLNGMPAANARARWCSSKCGTSPATSRDCTCACRGYGFLSQLSWWGNVG